MENSYTAFAKVYDKFMDNIPYEEWAEEISGILTAKNCKTVLELGCGTGTFSELLCEHGFEVVGIDLSPDMIEIANAKLSQDKSEQTLTRQQYKVCDMRSISYEQAFDAVISVCDSMNYLLAENDLKDTLDGAYRALKSEGVIIFDMKTEDFYRDELGDYTFAESREDCAYIWNNSFDENTKINEYELCLFWENEDGSYTRQNEIHRQRAFDEDAVMDMMTKVGYKNVACFEIEAGEGNDERIYFLGSK